MKERVECDVGSGYGSLETDVVVSSFFMLAIFMLTIQPKIVRIVTTTSVVKTDVFGDIVSYVCGPSNFVRFRGLDGPGTIHKHSLQFTDRHSMDVKTLRTHIRIKSRCKVPRCPRECEHRVEGRATAGKGEFRYTN